MLWKYITEVNCIGINKNCQGGIGIRGVLWKMLNPGPKSRRSGYCWIPWIPLIITYHHIISQPTTIYQSISQPTTAYHTLPLSTTAYHNLPSCTTAYHYLSLSIIAYQHLPPSTTAYQQKLFQSDCMLLSVPTSYFWRILTLQMPVTQSNSLLHVI